MNNTLIRPITSGEANTLFNAAKLAGASPTRRTKIQSRIWQNFNRGGVIECVNNISMGCTV